MTTGVVTTVENWHTKLCLRTIGTVPITHIMLLVSLPNSGKVTQDSLQQRDWNPPPAKKFNQPKECHNKAKEGF